VDGEGKNDKRRERSSSHSTPFPSLSSFQTPQPHRTSFPMLADNFGECSTGLDMPREVDGSMKEGGTDEMAQGRVSFQPTTSILPLFLSLADPLSRFSPLSRSSPAFQQLPPCTHSQDPPSLASSTLGSFSRFEGSRPLPLDLLSLLLLLSCSSARDLV